MPSGRWGECEWGPSAGGGPCGDSLCCLSVNEFTVIRKKFKCPYCSFSAMHQCILKRHMRSHTGERPYPCDICGKKFTRREHMKRHTLVSAAVGRGIGARLGTAGRVLGSILRSAGVCGWQCRMPPPDGES